MSALRSPHATPAAPAAPELPDLPDTDQPQEPDVRTPRDQHSRSASRAVARDLGRDAHVNDQRKPKRKAAPKPAPDAIRARTWRVRLTFESPVSVTAQAVRDLMMARLGTADARITRVREVLP